MTILTTLLKKAAGAYNNAHGVKLKKITEEGDYNLGGGIYRDSDSKEYVVFFVDGGEYLSRADYHTNDGPDAARTLNIFLHPHAGELEDTGVDPDKVEKLGDIPDPITEEYLKTGRLPGEAAPAPVRTKLHRHPNPLLAGLLMRNPYVAR